MVNLLVGIGVAGMLIGMGVTLLALHAIGHATDEAVADRLEQSALGRRGRGRW